jgi:hypothetical protein
MSSSRIQPVLSQGEWELVDQMARLTHTKRTEVIKQVAQSLCLLNSAALILNNSSILKARAGRPHA